VTGDARRTHLDLLAVGLIVGCCALWGLNQVVVKATLPHVPPLLQGGLRSAAAAALLWLFMARRGSALLADDRTTWPGIAAGVLFGLEFCCINFGLQYTTASRLVVFVYLAPFVVALGMPFISRAERLAPLQVAGLVAAFAALAYAFQEGFGAGAASAQWLGDALAVAGAILWGLTTLLVRATALSTASPERTLLFQLAVSAPVMLLASALAGEALPAPSLAAVASLLFQSAVVAFASYLVWFWLLRHYPATRVSSFTFLTPVSGLLFGTLLLGEPVTARLLVAVAGIAIGIWLVNRR
jgi:drug/metabolite transporter (DMT)-like permease